MKTVIIGGVSRAGKSQLANKLWQQTKATVFHADHLTTILSNNFSEQFSLNTEDPQYESAKLVVVKMVRNMGKEFDYLRIFDTSVLTPRKAVTKLNPKDQYIKLYVGYPTIDPLEKVAQIRDFARNYPHCWSHGLSDEKVLRFVKEFIRRSQVIQQECDEYGVRFIDISTAIRSQLENALRYLLAAI